jgi:hypothetical protein
MAMFNSYVSLPEGKSIVVGINVPVAFKPATFEGKTSNYFSPQRADCSWQARLARTFLQVDYGM